MKLLTEVAAEAQPDAPIAVLSGPTFADEVARGLPTAVTLAASDLGLARALTARLALPTFRPYASDDLIGAENGGAVAILPPMSFGVVDARGVGHKAGGGPL